MVESECWVSDRTQAYRGEGAKLTGSWQIEDLSSSKYKRKTTTMMIAVITAAAAAATMHPALECYVYAVCVCVCVYVWVLLVCPSLTDTPTTRATDRWMDGWIWYNLVACQLTVPYSAACKYLSYIDIMRANCLLPLPGLASPSHFAAMCFNNYLEKFSQNKQYSAVCTFLSDANDDSKSQKCVWMQYFQQQVWGISITFTCSVDTDLSMCYCKSINAGRTRAPSEIVWACCCRSCYFWRFSTLLKSPLLLKVQYLDPGWTDKNSGPILVVTKIDSLHTPPLFKRGTQTNKITFKVQPNYCFIHSIKVRGVQVLLGAFCHKLLQLMTKLWS